MFTEVFETPVAATSTALPTRSYKGPDRREPALSRSAAIALAMDELDHAMLLLDHEGHIVHRNYLAMVELDAKHPLCVKGRELVGRNQRDTDVLSKALVAARTLGIRKLISLRHAGEQLSVSVVPLACAGSGDEGVTLVMFSKRRLFDELTALSYAKCHGLSAAETRVVHCLCNGAAPAEVAARNGVKLSTVRTQIGNIRSKTGTRTVTELVRAIAVLPPLMGALRMGSAGRSN